MSLREQALDGEDSQWRGTTADERAEQRRVRLLEAALELLGTEGAAGVTVRAVVRASALSPRFFYESFSDRDALLIVVADHGHSFQVGVTSRRRLSADNVEEIAPIPGEGGANAAWGGGVALLSPVAENGCPGQRAPRVST